ITGKVAAIESVSASSRLLITILIVRDRLPEPRNDRVALAVSYGRYFMRSFRTKGDERTRFASHATLALGAKIREQQRTTAVRVRLWHLRFTTQKKKHRKKSAEQHRRGARD